MRAPTKGWTLGAKLGGIAMLLFVVWLFVHGESAPAPTVVSAAVAAVADRELDPIYKKVEDDSVAQYNIAKRNGSAVDACAHAGMVAAAFLQAKDEAGYKTWKQTEAADCGKAGMPAP